MRKLAFMLSVAVLAAGPTFATEAASVDWSKVPTKAVTLFYPGQSSYQWLRSKEHKRAFRKTEQGDSCASCHEGEGQRVSPEDPRHSRRLVPDGDQGAPVYVGDQLRFRPGRHRDPRRRDHWDRH